LAALGESVEGYCAATVGAEGDGKFNVACGEPIEIANDLGAGFGGLNEFTIAAGAVRFEGGKDFDGFDEIGFALGIVAEVLAAVKETCCSL
jgi:hypothetical protein